MIDDFVLDKPISITDVLNIIEEESTYQEQSATSIDVDVIHNDLLEINNNLQFISFIILCSLIFPYIKSCFNNLLKGV